MLHPDAGVHLLQACVSYMLFEWMLYYLSPWIMQFFPATKNFNEVQREEFKTRTIAVIHAFIISVLSVYALIFDEASQQDMIWGDSWTIRTNLAISIGYFASDLRFILKDVENSGGGVGYVYHHLSALWPYLLVINLGCLLYYANFRLLAEISTPCVNLRWYLDITGRKDSKFYFYNGLVLASTFFLFRIAAMPYYYYLVYLEWGTEAFDSLGPLIIVSWLLPCVILDALNINWFWKIMRGALKVLERRKSQSQDKDAKQLNGNVEKRNFTDSTVTKRHSKEDDDRQDERSENGYINGDPVTSTGIIGKEEAADDNANHLLNERAKIE